MENFQGGVITSQELVETFGTATQNILKNLGEIVPRLGKTGLEVVGAIADKLAIPFQRRKVLLMQLETLLISSAVWIPDNLQTLVRCPQF